MLIKLLPCWGGSPNSHVSLLSASENVTFAVDDPNIGRRVFRLYRPGYHNNIEILSELQWMQELAKINIFKIPHVYPTLHGKFLVVCCKEAGMIWRVACFEYLSGTTPSVNQTLSHWFEKLGTIAAQLHVQSKNWLKPYGFFRKHWNYESMVGHEAYWGNWRRVINLHPSAYRLLERCDQVVKEYANCLSVHDEDYILLHGDLRPANLLIEGGTLSVIDFDDCGFSWKALDFSNAVSFMEKHPLIPELQQAWISGYKTITVPSKQLLTSIRPFIMMRRMQLTAWLATHNETSIARKLGSAFMLETIDFAEDFLTYYNKNDGL